MRALVYILKDNSNADSISCPVPMIVDKELVFFGPCKKRMREELRKQFLGPSCGHCKVTEDLFIVGMNGSNLSKTRKILWVGKLLEVMTFAEADKRLSGERFRRLREHPLSPLHVRPIFRDGSLFGYQHVSNEHRENDKWISDLASKPAQQVNIQKDRTITLRSGDAWYGFDRDCCLLLENQFFARGKGIEVDDEIVMMLREAQPQKQHIDSYAVFGLNAIGKVDGKTGSFLKISGELASQFVLLLNARATELIKYQSDVGAISPQGSGIIQLGLGPLAPRHK